MATLCGCALPVKEPPAGGEYVTVDSPDKIPPGYAAVPVQQTPTRATAPPPGYTASPSMTPPPAEYQGVSPMTVPRGYAVSADPAAPPTMAAKMDKDMRHFGTGIKHAFRAAGKSVDKAGKQAVTQMDKAAKSAMKATTKAAAQAQADIEKLGLSGHGKDKYANLHMTMSRNHRNNMMVHEVSTFARQVQLLHYDISTWSAGVDAGLNTMKKMLDSPLPIPYDNGEYGVEAFDATPHPVGHSVTTNNFPKAVNLMKAKLDTECLGPLAQWMEAVAGIQERNLRCHKLGLEVDGQTNVVAKATEKVEAHKARVANIQPGMTPDPNLELAMVVQQTEEDKLVRLEQRFAAMEGDVFNHLLDVTRDAQVVREYAAAALVIMQGASHTGLASFDLNAEPDPYKLPPAAVADVKLPTMAAVKIPMADMRSAGLYTHRETLCTHTADPLAAASDGGAALLSDPSLPTPPEAAMKSVSAGGAGASTSAGLPPKVPEPEAAS